MRTEREILRLLQGWGARRLEVVRLRSNRSTIWSLTREGRALNLHIAFAAAPPAILRRFATIARDHERGSVAFQEATETVRSWPPVLRAIRQARAGRTRGSGSPRGDGPCCATPAQRVYLQRLYVWLNETRFDGLLPARIHLRLSNRMRSRLGQMVPCTRAGRREVVEIALNVDLMLAGNGHLRLDTLIHEMAHAADWIYDGKVGHGSSWKDWARFSGCEPRACTVAGFRRRPGRAKTVERVPELPKAARSWTG